MKKTTFIITILLVLIVSTTPVYAGSINSYEQDVIAAAKRTFLYQGEEYKLAPSYISQLVNYLMDDGVDLTLEQRNTVLRAIDGYIETGVQGGYLVPADDPLDSNQGVTTQTPDASDNSDQTQENTETDNTGQNGIETEGDEENDSPPGTLQPNNESGISSEDSIGSAIQQTNQNNEENKSQDFIEDILDGVETNQNSVSGQTSDQTKDSDGKEKEVDTKGSESGASRDSSSAEDSAIIKDTGFDLSTTFVVIIIMGVLMLAGIIVTIRNQYFAHQDEP